MKAKRRERACASVKDAKDQIAGVATLRLIAFVGDRCACRRSVVLFSNTMIEKQQLLLLRS